MSNRSIPQLKYEIRSTPWLDYNRSHNSKEAQYEVGVDYTQNSELLEKSDSFYKELPIDSLPIGSPSVPRSSFSSRFAPMPVATEKC